MKFHAPASEHEAQREFAILQSNPLLNGVLITALWKDLEPARDQYDFSSLDHAVAAVRKAGKHYKLAIVPGMNSPAYIYTSGEARFPTKVVGTAILPSNHSSANFSNLITFGST